MDAQATALSSLKNVAKAFLSDLEALPDSAFGQSFGPKARTVADIVFEVNLVNDHIGMVIRGEQPFDWPEEGWIKAPPRFAGKEQIIQAFRESSDRIISTIQSFTPEQMEEPIQTENGETNRFARCQFMALHLWYHSGQLNFIQTLIGDDEWHWK